MPREKLDDPGYEEETFEEQMDALGVEIVKPKTEIERYKIDKSRAGKIGLKDKVSVTTTGITLGGEAVKMLGADSRLKVAVIKITKAGIDEITFALKPGNDGFKITRSRANSFRIGAKGVTEWLLAKGVKKGRYSLKKIEGGYIAAAVKDGGGK